MAVFLMSRVDSSYDNVDEHRPSFRLLISDIKIPDISKTKTLTL